LSELEKECPPDGGLEHPCVTHMKAELEKRLAEKKERLPIISQLGEAEKQVEDAAKKLEQLQKRREELQAKIVKIDEEVPNLEVALELATQARDELKLQYRRGGKEATAEAEGGLERLKTCFINAVKAAQAGTLTDPAALEKQFLEDVTVVKRGIAGADADALTSALAGCSVASGAGDGPIAGVPPSVDTNMEGQ